MVLVVAELLSDVQANKNAGRKANSQAKHIDKTEGFMAGQEAKVGS